MRTLSSLLLILLTILTGCTPGPTDPRLFQINEISETSPREALDSLRVIIPDELTEPDRHFYDFLSVKVADKAYVAHTSDSLILRVIDYESRHKKLCRFPEALYYGGRVFSDLGDYPTALRYFQDAMELIPKGHPDLNLRANIVSQYGGLLNKLRLYDEAIPFVNESIEIDRQLNDTVNEVYDLLLAGCITMRASKFDLAKEYINQAFRKSSKLPIHLHYYASMYMGAVNFYTDNIDSARTYIYRTFESVSDQARNSALAYGAEIYKASGMVDSAYWCASRLINSRDTLNKRFGYKILLSPEVISKVDNDSLQHYFTEYTKALNGILNDNSNLLAVTQHSAYNYDLHKREREKSEKRNITLTYWILGAASLILLLSYLALILKYSYNKTRLRLRDAIENINRLEHSLKSKNESIRQADYEYLDYTQNSVEELRKTLRSKLYSLYSSGNQSASIAPAILTSTAYTKLEDHIKSSRHIKDDSPLWRELEEAVIASSPNFKTNLQLLVGGKLTMNDLQTSILIKCGVTPTQMTILLNRAKGTIASRRESLGLRVFDQKTATKVIDGIIRLL